MKIALMTDAAHNGLWLQVGDEWFCVIDVFGHAANVKVPSLLSYATSGRARLYKDLSSIVLGEETENDSDSRT